MSRSKLRGFLGVCLETSAANLCLAVGCLVLETTAAEVLEVGVLVEEAVAGAFFVLPVKV